MASSAVREAGISVMMRPWAEEAETPARSAVPATPAQRFWRALAQFLFDYNRY